MKKKWLTGDNVFKRLSALEISSLEDAEKIEYKDAETQHLEDRLKAIEGKENASKDEVESIIKELSDLKTQQINQLQANVKTLGEALANAKTVDGAKKSNLLVALEKLEGGLASLPKGDSGAIEIKADITHSTLTHGGQLDQYVGFGADVVKKTLKIYSLFRKIPMTTEYYTFLQQKNNVIRDAKNVAKCVKGLTTTTKEELEVVRTTYEKIKDLADICNDFLNDYAFVEGRYRILLEDSVAFRVDRQLLRGSGVAGTEMKSISSVSSEFSAINVDCPLNASIDNANLADLWLGMATQIDVLGQLGGYNADTVICNKRDFFVEIESKKDLEGRYLDPRMSKVGNEYYIGSLRVIASVDCAPNTCYVFDSTKGSILERSGILLSRSEENGTNFADDFTTLKAVWRGQFLVEGNNANAFMKCSNVNLALGAIEKP